MPKNKDFEIPEVIHSFVGRFRYMSSFSPAYVKYDDDYYPSNENAFQAAKLADRKMRVRFHSIVEVEQPDGTKKKLLPYTSPEAKAEGKKVELRPDWDSMKDGIMLDLNRQKFQLPLYKHLLKLTGTTPIVEGNWWHDNYWGVCHGKSKKGCEGCIKNKKVGLNKLGEILMLVRSELLAEGN